MKTASTFYKYELSLLPEGTEQLFLKIVGILGLEEDVYKKTYNTRPIDILLKRQILAWILHRSPFYLSYSKIARMLSKNHATMIHADKAISNILEVPNKYKGMVLSLVRKIVYTMLADSTVYVDMSDYSKYGIIDNRVKSFKSYVLEIVKEVSSLAMYHNLLATIYNNPDPIKKYLLNMVSRVASMPDIQNMFVHEYDMEVDSLVNRINNHGLDSRSTLIILYASDPRMNELYSKLTTKTNVKVLLLEGDFTGILNVMDKYPLVIYIGNQFLVSTWIYGAAVFEYTLDNKLRLFRP